MSKQTWIFGLVTLVSLLAMGDAVMAEKDEKKSDPPTLEKGVEKETESVTDAKEVDVWKPAVEPKPLSDQVQKGLDWLLGHQLESGAWGQGEESMNMQSSSRIFLDGLKGTRDVKNSRMVSPLIKSESSDLKSKPHDQKPLAKKAEQPKSTEIPSVADTCMATLALIRSGSRPSKGPFAKNILNAVNFLCSEIEAADEKSPYITKTRGTRVQSKLGPYIDTFMAAMLLPEVLKQMPNAEGNQRVKKSLAKVLKKMELNQRDDGTWSDAGWAAALSQGVAAKGLNRAMQSGMKVPQTMQRRAESSAKQSFDAKAGKFSSKGSAGVALYSSSSNMSALADSVNSNERLQKEAELELKEATNDKDRKKAHDKLERFEKAEEALSAQKAAVIKKLGNKNFIAGFGNNGGEEFLSYMNIGESLVVKGDNDWLKWDKSITKNLNEIQNQDGSWSGHHCITGRTFCTSAALLVLMVDRAPFPVSDKVKSQR